MTGAAPALRLAAVLVVGGILFAAPIVLFPGVALAMLVGASWIWVRISAAAVEVRRIGLPAQITEGERHAIDFEIVAGRLPLIARLEDGTITGPVSIRILRPGGRVALRIDGTLARRGRHRLAPPALVVSDPLGIAEARATTGDPASVLVLPRVEPIGGSSNPDGPAVGRRSRGLGELAGGGERESSADPDLDGVRPYRPGTRATRIYWPALARGAELAERHLVAAGDAAPLIAFDPSGAPVGEELDRAARAAASLMAHLARLGGCDLLVAGSHARLTVGRDPRAWVKALAAIAVVGPADGAPRLARGDVRSAVVWVGAGTSPRPPRGVCRGFVVATRPAPGLAPAFTVAGCSGYDLAGPEVGRWAA